MLEVSGLRLSLPDRGAKPAFGSAPLVDILKGIDLKLDHGRSLGIVGESGSGKTSLGRTILRLYRPTAGRIVFDGLDITDLDERTLRPLRARMQMIFQDPQSSLNPRHRIGRILAQPLIALGRASGSRHESDLVASALDRVGLPSSFADRFPHELSGGQRQRVGIARAIIVDPALVVADEIVSGLDVSTQAEILDLLRALKTELRLSLVFISHDLSVVRVLCDDVLVILEGEVVERGPCAEIFARPRHPYTQRLVDAIPLPDVDPGWIGRDAVEYYDPEDRPQGGGKMKVSGCVALVTGSNRGIGKAYVEELLARGAAKVYAAARIKGDAEAAFSDQRVVPVGLDTTDDAQVDEAAARLSDVTLLINNAGVNYNTPLLGIHSLENARHEMEVNYFGKLAMCRAFAPVLEANGGGAIVNMLSILSRANVPLMGSLCASKAAALSMTHGVRAELAKQGTLVVAVMPGAVRTRMTENFPGDKMEPEDVVKAALDAVESGIEDIHPGDMAQGIMQGLAADPKAVEKELAGYLPE
jgi:peptide/nickel transport system ATP-binding protein